MDLSNTPTVPTAAVRHDGWTPARRTQFLDRLAQDGNVLAACALVGMSREAAYRLRRREPLFARAWAAAQALAREAWAQELGTRALDGVEEDVWYRGEVVGTRRRYDNRLLLAHIARLDKLAEAHPEAEADAERFDELLACIAGEVVPEELAVEGEALPVDRATCALMTAELASEEALEDERAEAYRRAHAEGEALWDAWFAGACDAVDRLLAEPPAASATSGLRTPSTLSGVSTSALASALLARRPHASQAGCQSGSANT